MDLKKRTRLLGLRVDALADAVKRGPTDYALDRLEEEAAGFLEQVREFRRATQCDKDGSYDAGNPEQWEDDHANQIGGIRHPPECPTCNPEVERRG